MGAGPFHMSGRGALSYEWARGPFISPVAWRFHRGKCGALPYRRLRGLSISGRGGPFHIGGRGALSYRRTRGPYISAGVGPFHMCPGQYDNTTTYQFSFVNILFYYNFLMFLKLRIARGRNGCNGSPPALHAFKGGCLLAIFHFSTIM